MKRLPDNFKPALEIVHEKFKYKDNMSYQQLNKEYKKITKIFNDYGCESYDINNVMHNYTLDSQYNETIDGMRKLTIERNKNIVHNLYKTKKWYLFINKIKSDMNEIFDDHVHSQDIVDGIFHVMKKYSNNWLGFWSIVKLNDNGNINDIEMIDIEDIEMLKQFLKKKYKLKTKKQIKEEDIN